MAERLFALILAGGTSERMGRNKLLMSIGGVTPIERCVQAFLRSSSVPESIIIAASQECMPVARMLCGKYKNVRVVAGGRNRGESAWNALSSINAEDGLVAIHDAARCLVTTEVIDASYTTARERGCGVAAVSARDTIRTASGMAVPRDGLYCVQTPQTFDLSRLKSAYALAIQNAKEYTDDLGVWLAAGHECAYSKGNIMNQKLTYENDLPFFNVCANMGFRIGYGEDTHRLVDDRKLILGGVELPYEKGLLGHSDADVLVHAIIDALLGATALGDIGAHFPDTKDCYRGISSLELLSEAKNLLQQHGFYAANIDATVIAQRPKLSPYILDMRRRLASVLDMNIENVSVKATTTEGMNAEGRGECITARAVCTVRKI